MPLARMSLRYRAPCTSTPVAVPSWLTAGSADGCAGAWSSWSRLRPPVSAQAKKPLWSSGHHNTLQPASPPTQKPQCMLLRTHTTWVRSIAYGFITRRTHHNMIPFLKGYPYSSVCRLLRRNEPRDLSSSLRRSLTPWLRCAPALDTHRLKSGRRNR